MGIRAVNFRVVFFERLPQAIPMKELEEFVGYGRCAIKDLLPHKNKGMEITYIEHGSFEWMVDGRAEKVEAGSIFFTLPWQVHGSLLPINPNNITWYALFHLEEDFSTPHKQFRFPASFGFDPIEMKILSNTFAASQNHCFQSTETMRKLIPALVYELDNTKDLRKANSISLLRAVLIELKRTIAGETFTLEATGPFGKKIKSLMIELSSNCEQQWTLEQMADLCGIRRTHLNTVFYKLTGHTPMEYLATLRIAKAKTMLRQPESKIIDIAFACGFGSSQYFSNVFKKAIGLSPSEYRSQCASPTITELRVWAAADFRSEQEERYRAKTFRKD
jgi:AraC family L-rhamnose operon regulatory protein RhaS